MNTSLPHSFIGIAQCGALIQRLSEISPELGLTPILTLDQCHTYCGTSYGPYNTYDALETIALWVIPLFQLSANMNFSDSPGGCIPHAGKLYVFFHQFADPIGTIRNLSLKLDLGRRLRKHCDGLNLTHLGLDELQEKRARRDIANLCFCLNDFGNTDFEKQVNRISALVQRPDDGLKYYRDIKSISRDLALARTRNIIPTFSAVFVYLGSAFATLLRSDEQSTLIYAQPHTIALRVLCYFLLLQIVLSSAAGGWPDHFTPQSFLKKLGERLNNHDRPFGWEKLGTTEIKLWDGGLYTFKPPKIASRPRAKTTDNTPSFSSHPDSSRHLLLIFLAFLSLSLSFTVSFLMSWVTPTVGIGGRGIAELTYFGVWILNFLLNEWLTRMIKNPKTLFTVMLFKENVICILVLLFFFLPFLGWYNSCDSWSAVFSLGHAHAYINLDLESVEQSHTWSYYFAGIAAGVVAQGLLAWIIIGMNFDAVRLSHRARKEIRQELEEDLNPQTQHPPDFLPPIRYSTSIELDDFSQSDQASRGGSVGSMKIVQLSSHTQNQTRTLARGNYSCANSTSERRYARSETRKLLSDDTTTPLDHLGRV